MSKYNVGDVVKLRDDLEEGERYDELKFDANMENLKNKPVKIIGIDLEGDYETESWYINDEMIEGLWEECKENQDKVKLIDVLNMIAKGELKEGTKVGLRNNVYTFERHYWNDASLGLFRGNGKQSVFEDFCLSHILNDEVELIELPCEHEWEIETIRNGIGDLRRFRRCVKCGFREEANKWIPDEGKTLEPSKIEELDEKVFAECDNIGKFYRLLYKLNEVIRKIDTLTNK